MPPEAPPPDWLPPDGDWLPPDGDWLPPDGDWLPPDGDWLPPDGDWLPPDGVWLPPDGDWLPPDGDWLPLDGGGGIPPLGAGMPAGGAVGPPERVIDVLQPARTSVVAPIRSTGLSHVTVLRAVCLEYMFECPLREGRRGPRRWCRFGLERPAVKGLSRATGPEFRRITSNVETDSVRRVSNDDNTPPAADQYPGTSFRPVPLN